MGVHLGLKDIFAKAIIISGLENIDITSDDVRTGTVSIDAEGFPVYGNSSGKFLENNTSDATVTAADINNGKVAYAAGARLVGKYVKPDISNGIRGDLVEVIAGEAIIAGAFVKLSSNRVYNVTSADDVIYGIAKTPASTYSTLTVYVPYK